MNKSTLDMEARFLDAFYADIVERSNRLGYTLKRDCDLGEVIMKGDEYVSIINDDVATFFLARDLVKYNAITSTFEHLGLRWTRDNGVHAICKH